MSKENDTITIELTVNDTITSSTVKILNQTVQEVVNDNHINESFIVPFEGNLTFEIMVENAQCNTIVTVRTLLSPRLPAASVSAVYV